MDNHIRNLYATTQIPHEACSMRENDDTTTARIAPRQSTPIATFIDAASKVYAWPVHGGSRQPLTADDTAKRAKECQCLLGRSRSDSDAIAQEIGAARPSGASPLRMNTPSSSRSGTIGCPSNLTQRAQEVRKQTGRHESGQAGMKSDARTCHLPV
jgi:hypothetical protein